MSISYDGTIHSVIRHLDPHAPSRTVIRRAEIGETSFERGKSLGALVPLFTPESGHDEWSDLPGIAFLIRDGGVHQGPCNG